MTTKQPKSSISSQGVAAPQAPAVDESASDEAFSLGAAHSAMETVASAADARPELSQLRRLLTSLPPSAPHRRSIDENVDELTAAWARISKDEAAHEGSIRIEDQPDAAEAVEGEISTSVRHLPRFAFSEDQVERPELQLGETIGKGGMGLVRHAEQLPLKRQVAVKQIHKRLLNEKRIKAMLQEAWITGMLEHPNIVPIHGLGLDQDGAPMLMMKRIEGVPWSELMFKPKHPLRKRDSREHLEWNVGILMQLCNAVSFAHSKGILHRDLKPDNVMIGAFGEVYLLDWGLSVALSPSVGEHLPQASEIARIAGTPSYMAPEMAVVAASMINERTDVYLLGAILHEIVVGRPRHVGSSATEILTSALYSDPFDYDASVPKELVSILHKATHVNPKMRYPSVEAFRHALELYLQRRHAIRLSHKAHRRLDELKAETAAEGPNGELLIHGLFRECRFGFRESLRVWEQNQSAIDGLQEAVETMIGYELNRGDARAARTLFGELLRPNEGLRARLDALQASLDAKEKRVEQLEQLTHDLDIEVGKGARSWALLWVGVLCGMVSGSLLMLERLTTLKFNYAMSLSSGGFVALCLVILAFTARGGFFQNQASRRMLLTVSVLVVMMLVHPLGCMLLGTPPHQSLIQLMLLFAAGIAITAAMQDLRLFAASGVYLVAYLTAAAVPGRILEIMTVANSLGPMLIAWVWRPGSPPQPGALATSEESRP